MRRRFRSCTIGQYRSRSRTFPWRSSSNPYHVLVGEVLLQRTRAENVAPVYEEFIRKYPEPHSLADANPTDVGDLIAPLGLRKRSSYLIGLGHDLRKLGGVPREPDLLLELHGIGPYVAHAVPIFALNRNLPLVDWVIARVLRRYFGLQGDKRPNADRPLWELARALARPGRARELWLGTLDFAAATCKKRPRCDECALAKTCRWLAANSSGQPSP